MIPISLSSILILSSHLRLGLAKGIFPTGVPVKILKELLSSNEELCEVSEWRFFRCEVVSLTPKSQAEGSLLVGCLQLLIQYIRSYPPYLEAYSPICTQGTSHVVVTETHGWFLCTIKQFHSKLQYLLLFVLYHSSSRLYPA